MSIDWKYLYIRHTGVDHLHSTPGSGRYHYGTGENAYQHAADFRSMVARMRKDGLTDKEIYEGLNMSSSEFRAKVGVTKAQLQSHQKHRAYELYDQHKYSYRQIGELVGIKDDVPTEGTIRKWVKERNENSDAKMYQIADTIRARVDKKGMVDVGKGVERVLTDELGFKVTPTQMEKAELLLKNEGYYVDRQAFAYEQGGIPGNWTKVAVVAKPGTDTEYIKKNRDKVATIVDFETKTGLSDKGLPPVNSIDSSRIKVRYAEEGGKDKDGVIELRRGQEDLNLGNAMYAQVRIGVDGTHYMKGMAVYGDNFPKGVDVIYNTNKSKGTPLISKTGKCVLKPMEIDPKTGKIDKENPFGATIKLEQDLSQIQRYYTNSKGEKKVSPINVVNEQGDWDDWSKTLASQMLSKQDPKLAKQQLDKAYSDSKKEFDEIKSLTNPSLKKILLEPFANDCDASAVDLKAAAMPRQASKVILPLTSIKDNEIYAPTYKDGESVVLVRYPHAGIFELPRLTVNNNNKEAKKVITPSAVDAVGINAKVAEQLSGADYDGDTVLVIPDNKRRIKTAKGIDSLIEFDPRESYPETPGMKYMSKSARGSEMGKITNLIADMTLVYNDDQTKPVSKRKYKPDEFENDITDAVKCSMVIIDAEKHKLDYMQAKKDFNISHLKKKYRPENPTGSNTLITRAGSDVDEPLKKEVRSTSKMTKEEQEAYANGQKIYRQTGETTKSGKIKTTKEKRMNLVSDAYDLIPPGRSPFEIEKVYADYANNMKALGNSARREMMTIKRDQKNPSAAVTYRPEVDSLNYKLSEAQKNAPRERKAQLVADAKVYEDRKYDPNMTKEEISKRKGQYLTTARLNFGAKKPTIDITDREWQAIQANAISPTKQEEIFKNADLDELKKRAMPRSSAAVSDNLASRMRSMKNRGYTLEEIAERCGVSTSTVSKAVNS